MPHIMPRVANAVKQQTTLAFMMTVMIVQYMIGTCMSMKYQLYFDWIFTCFESCNIFITFG